MSNVRSFFWTTRYIYHIPFGADNLIRNSKKESSKIILSQLIQDANTDDRDVLVIFRILLQKLHQTFYIVLQENEKQN